MGWAKLLKKCQETFEPDQKVLKHSTATEPTSQHETFHWKIQPLSTVFQGSSQTQRLFKKLSHPK